MLQYLFIWNGKEGDKDTFSYGTSESKRKDRKKKGASTQQTRPLYRYSSKVFLYLCYRIYHTYQYLVTKRNRSLYKAHAVYISRVPLLLHNHHIHIYLFPYRYAFNITKLSIYFKK